MIALDAVADQLLAEQQRDAASGGFHQRLEHLHALLLAVPTGSGSGPPSGAAGRSETGQPRGGSAFTGS